MQVSTLDEELEGLAPTVVKIDVEGAELDVLEGGRRVLGETKPHVIFEHVASAAALYDAPPEGCWDLLSELGYEVFTLTGEGPFTRRSSPPELPAASRSTGWRGRRAHVHGDLAARARERVGVGGRAQPHHRTCRASRRRASARRRPTRPRSWTAPSRS